MRIAQKHFGDICDFGSRLQIRGRTFAVLLES
jgi:hypothetical protein